MTAHPHVLHTPARRPSRRRDAAIAIVLALLLVLPVAGAAPAQAATGTIWGTAFADLDRDGRKGRGEQPFPGHVIYLFDEAGAWVASRTTDADGRFTFSDLPAGTYQVSYMPKAWREIWSDWVPTTTGSLYPRLSVPLTGTHSTADFGWRPITWSTDLAAPISEVAGAEGLVVQSYNDAVTAQEVYDYIVTNFLVGAEAPTTTVRFAYGSWNIAQTSIAQSNGRVTGVRTTAYASYETMLSSGTHHALAHEYGHAWTNYHNYYVQQDIDRHWLTYLAARGIDPNDDRLGSSSWWKPGEIAAEDYRQLFTTAQTSADRHKNLDLPDAWEVDGLKAFLRDTFTTPPGSPAPNVAPTADFTAACDGLHCAFADGSTDGDGTVTAWSWTFGDGVTSIASDPTRTYAGAGTYTVTLTVTDDGGATGAAQHEVTVTAPAGDSPPPADGPVFTLTAAGEKVRGLQKATLHWTAGPDGTAVDIYRTGQAIGTATGSTGSYHDAIDQRGGGSYTYQVCPAGAPAGDGACSTTATVVF